MASSNDHKIWSLGLSFSAGSRYNVSSGLSRLFLASCCHCSGSSWKFKMFLLFFMVFYPFLELLILVNINNLVPNQKIHHRLRRHFPYRHFPGILVKLPWLDLSDLAPH